MSKKRRSKQSERRLRVRGIRRNPPDLRKLAQALIALAQAQAEADAAVQAERQAARQRRARDRRDDGDVPTGDAA